MVRQIQNLIWHLRDGCDRTKGLFSSSPKKPSNSTLSPRRNSHSVRLLRLTLSVQRNWKRLCWKRRQPSSGSRRKRDASQRRLLQWLDVFKASGTEANLLHPKTLAVNFETLELLHVCVYSTLVDEIDQIFDLRRVLWETGYMGSAGFISIIE